MGGKRGRGSGEGWYSPLEPHRAKSLILLSPFLLGDHAKVLLQPSTAPPRHAPYKATPNEELGRQQTRLSYRQARSRPRRKRGKQGRAEPQSLKPRECVPTRILACVCLAGCNAWSPGRRGLKLIHHIIHFLLCLLQKIIPRLWLAALRGEGGGHGARKSPEVENSNPFLLPA